MLKNSTFRLFPVLFAAIMLSGCGVKAYPSIPRQIMPAQVNDLKYDLKDNILNLSWTIPGTKDEKSVLDRFVIYSSKNALPGNACKKCPVLYKKSGQIRVMPKHLSKNRITCTQKLEKGYHYIFKVTGYTKKGLAGKDSNLIKFTYY